MLAAVYERVPRMRMWLDVHTPRIGRGQGSRGVCEKGRGSVKRRRAEHGVDVCDLVCGDPCARRARTYVWTGRDLAGFYRIRFMGFEYPFRLL